jgi:hypothetical protein
MGIVTKPETLPQLAGLQKGALKTSGISHRMALGQSGCSKRIFFSGLGAKKDNLFCFFWEAAKKTKKLGGKKLLCSNQIATLPTEF